MLNQFLQHLLIERGLAKNTILAYSADLDRWQDFMKARGITDLVKVTKEDVLAYREFLSENFAPTSTARQLAAVRSFYRFLMDEGYDPEDFLTELKPPKLAKGLPKAISISEVTRMLESFSEDDPVQVRDRAILELMYGTGARVSEITDLNVDDVADPEMIRLTGKGNKQRVVPVGSFAKDALEAYLVRVRPHLVEIAKRSTPALFLGVRGARLSRNSVWKIISDAAERAQISAHVSPHTLRHSYATHMIQGGADVRVVQELLGHASVATTQIYTQVTIDNLREAYAQSHPRAR